MWSADAFHNTQHQEDSFKQFSHPWYIHNAVKYLYAEPELHFSLFFMKPHSHLHTRQLYVLINLYHLPYGI